MALSHAENVVEPQLLFPSLDQKAVGIEEKMAAKIATTTVPIMRICSIAALPGKLSNPLFFAKKHMM
jgi:hypothetical protein